jgi:hypothetical protein
MSPEEEERTRASRVNAQAQAIADAQGRPLGPPGTSAGTDRPAGKPGYMSPEQAQEYVDRKNDRNETEAAIARYLPPDPDRTKTEVGH